MWPPCTFRRLLPRKGGNKVSSLYRNIQSENSCGKIVDINTEDEINQRIEVLQDPF